MCQTVNLGEAISVSILVTLAVWNQAGGRETFAFFRDFKVPGVRISQANLSLFRFPFVFSLQDCLKSYGG